MRRSGQSSVIGEGRRRHVMGGNVEGRRREGAGIYEGHKRIYERDSVAVRDDRKRTVMEAYVTVEYLSRRVVTGKVKATSIETEGRKYGSALSQVVLRGGDQRMVGGRIRRRRPRSDKLTTGSKK